MADASGLTPQERDKIIKDKLAEYKKKSKVFHMRWTPGDLLDDKVLKSTPAFWYMRFGWSRPQIEGMFFAAKIYIDRVFESALDAVFGTDGKGPRWLPSDKQEQNRGKWNRRGYYKTQPWWKVKALGDLGGSGQAQRSAKDEPYAYDKQWRMKQKDYEQDDASYGGKGGKGARNGGKWGDGKDKQSMNRQGRRRSILNTKLYPNAEKIWQKASNYGKKTDKINYKQFKDGMNAHNIDIDDDTAKKLFDVYADKDGLMNYSQFEKLLKQLDDTQVKPGVDIGSITMNDLGKNYKTILLMKRVLLAASMDIPFNVTDFLTGNITGNIGTPGLLLGKLATRDADWNERLNIMENIANNLGTNPEYDRFFEPNHASDLIMGWTAQMLDTKAPVSKTAVDQLPTIFHEIAEKSHPDVAMSHLDDVVDGLFNVMDNKKHEANHEAAAKALRDIVDDVVANQDAEAVLYLAGLLGEKTDIENCTDPDARKAALDNIKRIMMGDNEKMDPKAMPNDPDPRKEWLDTGTNNKEGPSEKLMDQGRDNPNTEKYYPNGIPDKDLVDDANSNMRGKKGARLQKSGANGDDGTGKWGGNKENYGSGPRGDRFGGKDDIADETGPAQYGGTDAVDRPMSEYGSEPDDPRRRKGKENDIKLKYGKMAPADKTGADPNNPNNAKGDPNRDPQGGPYGGDPSNPPNGGAGPNDPPYNGAGPNDPPYRGGDPSNPPNGGAGPNNPPYGRGDDPRNPPYGGAGPNDPNGDKNANHGPNGAGKGEDDLDDSGNPNDPGDKGGKRGGTKRQGTNGKKDFDGKFGDDSKKASPYGGAKIGSGDDQVKNKKGDYNQPRNKNNDNLGQNDGNGAPLDPENDEKKDAPMSSNEIGDEFRNVVSDAVSNAIHDPNKKNKENGAKTADILNDLAPNEFVNTLDPDAKNKFLNWKRGPMKPYQKKLPNPRKPLPNLNAGTAVTHTISGKQEVTIKPPTMPDI